MRKNAFTLAEVLITLTVIGIITAVIIPVAIHSKPDENTMKFKKAHNTLYRVISELVNSDKYYLNGDLGVKPNGSRVDSNINSNDATYLCKTFADNLTTKKVNCSKYLTRTDELAFYCSDWNGSSYSADEKCKQEAKNIGEEIVLNDGVVFYQLSPAFTFGYTGKYYSYDGAQETVNDSPFYYNENKEQGEIYRCSKVFCIDIDGIPNGSSENCDDKKDICPFAYSIRADGKIILHKRAKEWLEKSIQGEN